MNIDVIVNVLQEILNEQKETHKLDNQLVNKIENLAGKLERLEKEMNKQPNIASTDETKDLKIIAEGVENIKQLVALQQRNTLPQKRITILPEFKSPECYRLLFNCILYLTIATYSFLIIKIVADYWCK